MTADDIMAREAGMPIDDEHFVFQATRERVTKFAALVRAAALEEAAGVCDDKHDEWRFGDVEWIIQEYDGAERVAEKHRKWE